MHHDEQELQGGIGMTTKAGGLIPNCAPRQDVKKWSTSVATKCTRESPERCAHARRRRHPSRQDGRRPTRDNQGSRTCARGGTRKARVVRVNAAAGGAESAVRGCHG